MSNQSPIQESTKEFDNDYINQNRNEQEIQNSKESIISKDTELNILDNLDIQKIKELNSKCVEFIFEEKTDISLEILKKIELSLETNLTESKFNFDKKLIIIILHNLACCYQKLKDYDNCIMYLDSVIYHFDKELEKKHHIKINEDYLYHNLNKDQSNYSLLGDLILELRFSAKFHLQMCAALSQANRHIEALKHAKLAGLICEDNLIKTYYLFIQMKLKNVFSIGNTSNNNNNKDNKDNKEGEEEENDLKNIEKMKLIQKIVNDLYNRIINIRKHFYYNGKEKKNNKENNIYFESYLKYRKNEIHKYQKNITLLNDIRNVFGAEIKKNDWIQLLNIGNIMYLSPLNDEDLDLESDPKYELLRDAILEKVVMLTVSYFSIAMEMKQISSEQNNKKINGEFFHYLAVFFSNLYLPISCPIVKHYINSYYKYYEKDLDVVPEGKIIDFKIDLIRNEIEVNKDIQSFVRMQKINYSNNNTGLGNINNLNIVNINNKLYNKDFNNNENINNNIGIKKNKIPLGLKLSINLENILNKNHNDNINNNSNSKIRKLSSSNDNKHLNNSNNKNNKNNNFNNEKKNNDNFEIIPNKNNLNVAEKSKIKELPKFKLNFNKLNNSNEEIYPKEKEKSIQNNSNRIKIKKIQNKISTHTKTNRHSASINKIKKNKFNKNKGYKTERPNSNKRPININETLIIIKKEKNIGLDIKRISFIKSNYNKHLSKTSRYQNKKSPTAVNRGKIKGNLTDRSVADKNKSLKKSNEKKINNKYYKKNIGYLTHRELTNFKLKEKINLNNDVKSKNTNNIKDNNKDYKQMKSANSLNNNKYTNELNDKINNIIKTTKIFTNTAKYKSNINKDKYICKKNKINLIDRLYKNLFLLEIKDNSNYIYNNYGNTIEINKCGGNPDQIHNFNSLIKLKNPFKS